MIVGPSVRRRLSGGILQIQGQLGSRFHQLADLRAARTVVAEAGQRKQISAAYRLHAERIGIAGAVVIDIPRRGRDAGAVPVAPGLFDEADGLLPAGQSVQNAHPFALHGVGFPVVGRSANHLTQAASSSARARRSSSAPEHGRRTASRRRSATGMKNSPCSSGMAFTPAPKFAVECSMAFTPYGNRSSARPSAISAADRVREIWRRVLVLALDERIDDGALRVLVPDAEAALALDHIEILLPRDLQRLPGPRRQMVIRSSPPGPRNAARTLRRRTAAGPAAAHRASEVSASELRFQAELDVTRRVRPRRWSRSRANWNPCSRRGNWRGSED